MINWCFSLLMITWTPNIRTERTGPILQKEPELSLNNTLKVTKNRNNYVMLKNSRKKIHALIG